VRLPGQNREDFGAQHPLQLIRIGHLGGGNTLDQLRGGLHTDVGRDQQLFDLVEDLGVDLALAREDAADAVGENCGASWTGAASARENTPAGLRRRGVSRLRGRPGRRRIGFSFEPGHGREIPVVSGAGAEAPGRAVMRPVPQAA